MALVPIGDEQITVSTSSIGFTTAEVTTKVVLARCENIGSGGVIWWRPTGTASNSGANGEGRLAQYDSIEFYGQRAILSVEFIKNSGDSDVSLNVQYYGEG